MGKVKLKIWLMIIIIMIFAIATAQADVSVTVLTEEDKPVKGAWLFLNIKKKVEVTDNRTNDMGSARFSLPSPDRSFSLTVFKMGYYPETKQITENQSVTIRLKKVTRELTIRVKDREGVPLSNVSVMAGQLSTITDKNGVAEISISPFIKVFKITVDSGCEGSPPEKLATSFSEGEKLSKEISFTLERGYLVLRGRLLGNEERPLANTDVLINNVFHAVTNPQGSFELEVPCGHMYENVTIRPAKIEPFCDPVTAQAGVKRKGSILNVGDVRFRVKEELKVEVVDHKGRRLDDVEIMKGNEEIGRTGSDGTTIVRLCPGQEVTLRKTPGYRPSRITVEEPYHRLVRLEPIAYRLRGKVTSSDGNPLEGREFIINETLHVKTKGRGVFEKKFRFGDYSFGKTVSIRPAKIEPFCDPVTAQAGVKRTGSILNVGDVRFRVKEELKVEVVDHKGRRLDNVEIMKGNKEIGRTSIDGIANITLCPGEKVALRKRGYPDKTVPFEELFRQKKVEMELDVIFEADQILQECRGLFEEKRYEGALNLLETAQIDGWIHAQRLDALFLKGATKVMLKRYNEAIMDFNDVLREDEKHASANVELGAIYSLIRGEHAVALQFLNSAMERKQDLDTSDVCRLYLYSAIAHYYLRNFEEAKEYLDGLDADDYFLLEHCPLSDRTVAEELREILRR